MIAGYAIYQTAILILHVVVLPVGYRAIFAEDYRVNQLTPEPVGMCLNVKFRAFAIALVVLRVNIPETTPGILEYFYINQFRQ